MRPVFQVKKKPCPPSPPFRDYWTTLGLARATEFYPLFALSVKKLTMNDSSFGITRELVSLLDSVLAKTQSQNTPAMDLVLDVSLPKLLTEKLVAILLSSFKHR